MTILYALMHLIVDLLCAWAMFGLFRDGNSTDFLMYNFCAFALQMPLGALLDLLKIRRPGAPKVMALLGCGLTVLGALTRPAVLGVGNALFHVGGGMEVIRSDFARHRQGRELGLFVAPGAVGLYLGSQLSHGNTGLWTLLTGAAMLACIGWFLPAAPDSEMTTEKTEKSGRWLCAVSWW